MQALVLLNAGTVGSLARMVAAALQHDIAEGIAGTVLVEEAYTRREEDKTADDIGHVVEACFEKHNADYVAAFLHRNCSRLTLWAH